jgi:putative N6-adenine-specific DNA methylase
MARTRPGPSRRRASCFLVGIPGLEDALEAEALRAGFDGVTRVPGGVEIAGGMAEAARANMVLRTAVRVLWRVASFRAMHLAQLDKRSRKVPWRDWLPEGAGAGGGRVPILAHLSRQGGAATGGGRAGGGGDSRGRRAGIAVKVRIEDDLCTVSLDTSGEPLHRRGHKQFVGKAPLRETMAAAFLWQMGFDGTQTVVDPMCGSGRSRWRRRRSRRALCRGGTGPSPSRRWWAARGPRIEARARRLRKGGRFFGFDRDQGAIQGALKNAERAGCRRCVASPASR